MPKLKTHKGAQKRFTFTASGKIKRRRACASHLLTKKSAKRKRSLKRPTFVVKEEFRKVRSLLPYS